MSSRIEVLKSQIAKKEAEYQELSAKINKVSDTIAYYQLANGLSADSKKVLKDLNIKHSKLARNLDKRRDTIKKLYEELRQITES